MQHADIDDWTWIEVEPGVQDEVPVTYGRWSCHCGACISDWEDAYQLPEDV
jgi:hypothetical protein